MWIWNQRKSSQKLKNEEIIYHLKLRSNNSKWQRFFVCSETKPERPSSVMSSQLKIELFKWQNKKYYQAKLRCNRSRGAEIFANSDPSAMTPLSVIFLQLIILRLQNFKLRKSDLPSEIKIQFLQLNWISSYLWDKCYDPCICYGQTAGMASGIWKKGKLPLKTEINLLQVC